MRHGVYKFHRWPPRARIANAIWLSVEIVIGEPGKVERSAGKARRVVKI
jgi:phenylacetate-coenzyme A ligase PaaK-like adenylate-forming protein